MNSKLLTLVTVGLISSSGVATAAVVLGENFDELTPQLSATSVGAFAAVDGTNVDIVGGSLFGSLCAAPESGNCIDLNGSSGNPQGILQSNLEFSPGSYLLSFDLIGDQRGSTASATVTFGSYSQEFTLGSGDVTDGIVMDVPVTVTTPGYLTFASDVTGDVGLLLDDVVVSTASGSVPEPATLALLGLGLAGVALARRRRRPAQPF